MRPGVRSGSRRSRNPLSCQGTAGTAAQPAAQRHGCATAAPSLAELEQAVPGSSQDNRWQNEQSGERQSQWDVSALHSTLPSPDVQSAAVQDVQPLQIDRAPSWTTGLSEQPTAHQQMVLSALDSSLLVSTDLMPSLDGSLPATGNLIQDDESFLPQHLVSGAYSQPSPPAAYSIAVPHQLLQEAAPQHAGPLAISQPQHAAQTLLPWPSSSALGPLPPAATNASLMWQQSSGQPVPNNYMAPVCPSVHSGQLCPHVGAPSSQQIHQQQAYKPWVNRLRKHGNLLQPEGPCLEGHHGPGHHGPPALSFPHEQQV